jgi:hypothetical protein
MAAAVKISVTELDGSTQALQCRFAVITGGRELMQRLVFRTPAAFRQAALRQSPGVRTLFMSGRRGRYAQTSDIACRAFEHGMPLLQGAEFKSIPGRPE